jgi:hypothetical protein
MLGSNVGNIRYNGTGRVYMGDVGGASFVEIGELESLTFGQTASTEKLKSNRHAARATILEVDQEREANISLGLRELSEENLQVAMLGSAINADNQAAGFLDQVVAAFVNDRFIDLGKVNVFVTRITGAITGTLAVGDILTGDASGATMKVAHKGAGFVIAVNLSGTITPGEQLEKTADTDFIVATSVEHLEDVCVTSADGLTLRTQGPDYSLDPDYGMIRKLSTGGIAAGDVVSCDYAAVDRKYLHGMSAGSVEKRLIVVTDKDDLGPRQRYTFHKVKLAMNGDMPLIGDGVAAPTLQGSVIEDSAQPSGQGYYKLEMM